jgi:hypothetical protein
MLRMGCAEQLNTSLCNTIFLTGGHTSTTLHRLKPARISFFQKPFTFARKSFLRENFFLFCSVLGANNFSARNSNLIFCSAGSTKMTVRMFDRQFRVTPMRAREEKLHLSPPPAPKQVGVAQKGQFPLYFSFAPEQKYF